ncbi:MAG: hypothetical protein JXD22_00010 [Sedimentisphaerales bacterium]|nr:hypothetical protein [Sedimentisphaerales bacterium]
MVAIGTQALSGLDIVYLFVELTATITDAAAGGRVGFAVGPELFAVFSIPVALELQFVQPEAKQGDSQADQGDNQEENDDDKNAGEHCDILIAGGE